jgi:hypothetical protein
MDPGPDFRLFCLALRRPQSADDVLQMRELAARVTDWRPMLAGARRHRVAAPLLAGLRACDSPHLPAGLLAELNRLRLANARRSLVQVAEIERLGRLFYHAGIAVLVLKGEALSIHLYGEVGWRTARDIDLLVDPSRFVEARAVLVEAGYRQQSRSRSSQQEATYLRLIKEVEFVHATTGGMVELHHRLTANPYLLPGEFAALWNERDEVQFGGRLVATLPRHRLPLYLCAHGADHGWARLQWLVDFATAVQQTPNLPAMVEAADRFGLKPVFLHALHLSHACFATPVDDGLLVAHANSAQARRLDWLLRRLYAAADWHEAAPKRVLRYAFWERLYRLALKSDWRYWTNQVHQDWFCPADWDAVPLPEALAGLYPLVRPWGWLLRRRSLS